MRGKNVSAGGDLVRAKHYRSVGKNARASVAAWVAVQHLTGGETLVGLKVGTVFAQEPSGELSVPVIPPTNLGPANRGMLGIERRVQLVNVLRRNCNQL